MKCFLTEADKEFLLTDGMETFQCGLPELAWTTN